MEKLRVWGFSRSEGVQMSSALQILATFFFCLGALRASVRTMAPLGPGSLPGKFIFREPFFFWQHVTSIGITVNGENRGRPQGIFSFPPFFFFVALTRA